jgi:peptide-methionine (S)-S-oxide reductase
MGVFDLFSRSSTLVDEASALPGRAGYAYQVPTLHAVLGSPIQGPFPSDTEQIYLGMGCFWGAERKYWRMPGVLTTAVGYQGGYTPYPTYQEVCTGRTGHAEMVLVSYCPQQTSTYEVLKTFWENHDPTSGYRQGNDVGTQYRSAIYCTTAEQLAEARATAQAFGRVLASDGWGAITTEIELAYTRPFFYAEDYHQQYLHKVPNGYDCHSATGLELPSLV